LNIADRALISASVYALRATTDKTTGQVRRHFSILDGTGRPVKLSGKAAFHKIVTRFYL